MSVRRSPWALLSVCALALMTTSRLAHADDAQAVIAPSPNIKPGTNPSALFGGQRAATFGLGYGQLGSSYYFQLQTYVDFSLGPVGLGLALPINLLSPFPSPNPADKASAYGGVLRSEDWPKPNTAQAVAHYLSLIRSIRYGDPNGPIYAQYGQFFSYSLGHGSIIDRYSNALDVNNPKPGLAFAFNTDAGGLAVFTDNVSFPATNILAGRGYIRPLGFGDPGFFGKRWAIGLSYAEDRNAREVEPGAHGASVVGFDTDFQLLSNSVLTLIPYIDLNNQRTIQSSWGMHIGALARFTLPVLSIVHFWSRLEFRLMQPGYIPGYFDTTYDVERSQYPITLATGQSLAMPKANAAAALAPHGPQGLTALTKGIYGEATVDVLGLVQAGASYSTTPGVPYSNNLLMFATVPALSFLKVSAYYLRSNFDSASQIVQLDERSMIAAVIMYKVWGPLWAVAQFDRRWVADYAPGDTDRQHAIGYHGVNDTSFGVQAYVPF
jgi:hypothetical protein